LDRRAGVVIKACCDCYCKTGTEECPLDLG